MKQDGNVLYPAFSQPSINLQLKTQILYCDVAVCLVRITYLHDGKLVGLQHVLAEMPAT